MVFIVGLGNPGTRFSATRHNIGFEVIDRLAYDYNIKVDKKKHHAFVGKGVIKGEKVVLMKPQTYMNDSGRAIADALNFYKEDSDAVIIVFDDTSLDIGRLRIRERGSAGGHNGIKSIISHLGTQEFDRVKVGVGEKPPGWNLADYVLSRFDDSEMTIVRKSVKMSADAVAHMVDQGAQKAMNLYNGKTIENQE